ncbi:MAG: ThuA domain-containing protein [Verrucomicrobiota bacterium]
MKTVVPAIAIAAFAFALVSQKPAGGDPPPRAIEKIREVLPDKAYAKPAKPRRMLVFSRTSGYRHASIPTGHALLRELGGKTGAFQIVSSEDPADFEVEKLKQFDAVCFLSTTMNPFAPGKREWDKLDEAGKAAAKETEGRRKKNLMMFVKSGRGFVGIHAATDTFYDWPEYGEMINGFFDGHPWTANKMVSVKVEPGKEKHPLVAMFEGANVEFPEEIYQFKAPYDSKEVNMLLRLDTEKTDMKVGGIKRKDGDFGIAWHRPWGKGRVFYCSLGHNHEIYWHPKVVRHYLAGIQWALGDLKLGN